MVEEGEEEEEEEHQLTFVTIVDRRDIGEGFVHKFLNQPKRHTKNVMAIGQ
jgi:hypothetical protein